MLTFEMLTELDHYEIKKLIKHVALYPRRSRASEEFKTEQDIEKDLQHQIVRLRELCDRNGWTYDEYIEIASSESFEGRPVMRELLDSFSDGKYDAVIATKYDRFSRGGSADNEFFLVQLRRNNIVVVEADGNMYNPFNAKDLQSLKTSSFIANFEYTNFVERVTNARRVRAKEGKWTSGIPSYGYKFNRKTKKLEIDQEKGEIYRELILKPFLEGVPTSEITMNLNKKGIPSARGGEWNKGSVIRLLKDTTHCGTITYNKTVGSRNKRESTNRVPFKKMPENKWTVIHNAHEPLKSPEEHEQVMRIMSERGRTKINSYKHALSSLVKCSHCNKTMVIQKEKDKPYLFKKCSCGRNRGGGVEIVTDAIGESVLVLKNRIMNRIENHNEIDLQSNRALKAIEKYQEELKEEKDAFNRIDNLMIYGKITPEKGEESKITIGKKITELEQLIKDKEKEIEKLKNSSKDEMLKSINGFLKSLDKESDNEELALLYRSLIREIWWTREEDEVKVDVYFK